MSEEQEVKVGRKPKKICEMKGLELERWAILMRRNGQSIETMQFAATEGLTDSRDILVKSKEIELMCRSFENFDMVQFIIESDMCKVADKDDFFIYNPESKKRMTMRISSIGTMFSSEYIYKKSKQLYDTFNPRTPEVYINKGGQTFFNMYCPPDWYAKHFYRQAQLQPRDIPLIYVEFLNHLLNGDTESYTYLLKWLANSLVDRNYTYLVAVGKKGIGKGLLYQIVELLHGKGNTNDIQGKVFFKGTFNDKDIENKTLIYLNEVSKTSVEDMDKLKKLVDPTLRLEGKNAHAKYVDNYLNTMISSNDLTSLTITEDERRFSVISMTNTPSVEFWKGNHKAKVDELLNPENIAALGAYLLTQVKYTSEEMLRCFQSKSQMREIKSQAIQDWEDYFLFQYCRENAGKTISIAQVGDDVRKAMNNGRLRISMNIMRDLRDRFPGFFVARQTKLQDGSNGPIGLGFKALHTQPTREHFNLEVSETEE